MSFVSHLYLDPSEEYAVATFSPDLPIGKTFFWGGGINLLSLFPEPCFFLFCTFVLSASFLYTKRHYMFWTVIFLYLYLSHWQYCCWLLLEIFLFLCHYDWNAFHSNFSILSPLFLRVCTERHVVMVSRSIIHNFIICCFNVSAIFFVISCPRKTCVRLFFCL